MSFVVTYSFRDDFGGSLREDQFRAEIEADSEFSSVAVRDVGRNGNAVQVTFNENLNTAQQTALDNLVAAHVPVFPVTDNASNIMCVIVPRNNRYNFTQLSRVATFEYLGTSKMNPISFMSLLAYADTSVLSYDIRVYDLTNANEMFIGNFNNTTEQSIIVGNFYNMPNDRATIEIEIRIYVNGSSNNKFAYIDHIAVFE